MRLAVNPIGARTRAGSRALRIRLVMQRQPAVCQSTTTGASTRSAPLLRCLTRPRLTLPKSVVSSPAMQVCSVLLCREYMCMRTCACMQVLIWLRHRPRLCRLRPALSEPLWLVSLGGDA